MLQLKLPTDPRWVKLASISLESILTDHAYCEQKAALSCISLIAHYPEKEELVAQLAPIVTEEWSHFRTVLGELKKRNLKLGRKRRDEYVNELLKHQRRGFNEKEVLMDRLLIFALIEARSCERFKTLSENLDDAYLRDFYRQFMESEAGHYTLFMDLARYYFSDDEVKLRWNFLIQTEAEIIKSIELRGDRVH